MAKCPCSQKKYPKCCGRFHSGSAVAKTPEELMRSRYSAYVLELEDYVLASWHENTRPATASMGDNPKWVKLDIISSAQHGKLGYVHFKAYFMQDGEIHVMEEQAEFLREDGKWFYMTGQVA